LRGPHLRFVDGLAPRGVLHGLRDAARRRHADVRRGRSRGADEGESARRQGRRRGRHGRRAARAAQRRQRCAGAARCPPPRHARDSRARVARDPGREGAALSATIVRVIRGGVLLDIRAHRAEAADVLIEGDTIREIGAPGLAAPPDAAVVDARGLLLHPGLINAHTHAHGNLAKGMGDRWTLELLLTAGPWLSGGRSLEDKHLSAKLGAVEMVLKGCTAAYDLTLEWPAPTLEGLEAVGRAYAEVGMRAVVAPMVADRTFFEAIPGLMDVLPPAMQKDVEKLRPAPWKTSEANMRQALARWKLGAEQIRIAVAPTIPHHCSDEFISACVALSREHGVGMHSHVAESKVQAIVGLQPYGKTLTAHLDALGAPGAKADIVFLDLGHVNWIPLNDPTNQLVHTEDGGAVKHVMIGGRMVVQDRRVTTVDVAALARQVEAARQRLAGINAPGKALYEQLAVVV